MHFSDRLAGIIQRKNSCLMLGLDPNWEKLPAKYKADDSLAGKARAYEAFCLDRLHDCQEYVCGVKIQMAYFEALGSIGIKIVENIIRHIRDQHENLIIMIDAKRGDIGTTCEAYSQAFLGSGPLSGDAVTVNPFLGEDGLKPFYDYGTAKSTFVLVKTSNPSSHQYQANIYQDIARDLELAGKKGECGWSHLGAVVGATNEAGIAACRELLPHTWILAPGIGAQGGSMEDVMAIRDQNGLGVIVPISRAVLYAEDPKEAMRELWEAQKRD